MTVPRRASAFNEVPSEVVRRRWRPSCSTVSQVAVFRTILFSIALTLAAGPSLSAFCRAWWCDPHAAAQSGCHHDGDVGRTSISSIDDCQEETLGRIAAVKEELRRVASPGTQGHAVPVPRYQVGRPEAADSVRYARGLAPPTHDRPLSTPLRI